jgi:RpiB/LacA/LacB family sugar-phosphate isomerase
VTITIGIGRTRPPWSSSRRSSSTSRRRATRSKTTVPKGEAQSAGGDYPDVAVEVAETVARGEHERTIPVCGTGVGMSITANKVPGMRAAQGHDVLSTERARKSNDAQVLTNDQRVLRPKLAKAVVDAWLESEFGGLVGEEGPEDGRGGPPIPPGRRDDLLSNPCA